MGFGECYDRDLTAAGEAAAREGWLRGRRVLITGATGLVGSSLMDALLALNARTGAGMTLYAAGRGEAKVRARFPGAMERGELGFVPYDATGPLALPVEADCIVHAACSAHPLAYSTDPVGTMKANLTGTMELLEAARASGARVIFLSTGEIYGDDPPRPDGFREDECGAMDPMKPRACYPESKRAAETLCASYVAQYGVDAVVARLCHVYGPTMTADNSRADAQFLRKALAGEDIVMKSDGAQVRSWCYVADTVSALMLLMAKGEAGNAYNVANRGAVASIREYAQTLADIAGVGLRFELPPEAERAGYTRIARAVLDASRLEALGWTPRFSLREGLSHTYHALCGGQE